jgi:hypothetical protein
MITTPPHSTVPPNSGGVGLPVSGASLPVSPLVLPTPLPASGLPSNMCVLAGFPTLLASSTTGVTNPFGLWFANDHTLYVADEGDGVHDSTLYTHAAGQSAAGLQKWVLDPVAKTWKHVYTLQAGLDLGVAYTVTGYPTGNNGSGIGTDGTGLPWSPAADGLRNITGRVNEDGTVTIWGITSTVSGSGDQGRIRTGSSRSRITWPPPHQTGNTSPRFELPGSGKSCVACRSRLEPKSRPAAIDVEMTGSATRNGTTAGRDHVLASPASTHGSRSLGLSTFAPLLRFQRARPCAEM